MGSERILRACRSFYYAMRQHYGPEFLARGPSMTELRAIERRFASNSFPGCIGSMNCMTVK